MASIAALTSNPGTAALSALASSGPIAATSAKLALDPKAKARADAVNFESMFLSQMFGHMFAGLDGDGPLGGAGAAGMWRSFLGDEYGKSFAKAGGIGIADQVYRTLIAQQETRGH